MSGSKSEQNNKSSGRSSSWKILRGVLGSKKDLKRAASASGVLAKETTVSSSSPESSKSDLEEASGSMVDNSKQQLQQPQPKEEPTVMDAPAAPIVIPEPGADETIYPSSEEEEDDEDDEIQSMEEDEPAASSKPPPAPKQPPLQQQPQAPRLDQHGEAYEADIHENPTLLYSLIKNRKYTAAMKRVHRSAEETEIWMCEYSATDKTLQLRELPIHLAVSQLADPSNSESATQSINELISGLVVANAEGAFCTKYPDNRLPIFEALRHGASIETLSIFLIANPDATTLTCPATGMSLWQVNAERPPSALRQQVEEFLNLGTDFWRQAKQEANVRLRQTSLASRTGGKRSKKSGSKSGSASNKHQHHTGNTPTASQHNRTTPVTTSAAPPPLPLTESIDQRLAAAEERARLAEDKNAQLLRTMEALQVQYRDTALEVQDLEQENADLRYKFHAIYELLGKALAVGNTEADALSVRPEDSALHVMDQYGRLLHRHEHQREHVYSVQAALAKLLANMKEQDEQENRNRYHNQNNNPGTTNQDDDDAQSLAAESTGMYSFDASTLVSESTRHNYFPQQQTQIQFQQSRPTYSRTTSQGEFMWSPDDQTVSPMIMDTLSVVMEDSSVIEDSLSVILRSAAGGRRRRRRNLDADVHGGGFPRNITTTTDVVDDDLSCLLRQAARVEYEQDAIL